MKRISISFFLFAWLVMLVLAAQQLFAQTPGVKSVIINEWSQGNTVQTDGVGAEWVEILVVGNVSAGDTLLDLEDLRLSDAGGATVDYIKFNNNALWVDVPRGSIIVIYNGNNKSSALPADDLTFGSDNRVVIAHNNATYFTQVGTPDWMIGAASQMFPNSYSATDRPVLHQVASNIFDWEVHGPSSGAWPGTDQLVYYTSHYNSGTFTTSSLWEVKSYTSGYPGLSNGGDNSTFVTAMLNNSPSISITTTSPVNNALGTTLTFTIKIGVEVPAADVNGVSFKFYRGWPSSFYVNPAFFTTPYVVGQNLFGDGGGVSLIDTSTESYIINYSTIKTSGTTYKGSGGTVTQVTIKTQSPQVSHGSIVNFFLSSAYAALGTTSGRIVALTQFFSQTNVTFYTGGTNIISYLVVGKGDSDHSALVDATDVTQLASKFGLQGGAYNGTWTTCTKVTRDAWGVDGGATTNLAMWSDHNGDGRVDNLDVLAIGLCFATNYGSYPKSSPIHLATSGSLLNFKIVDEAGNLITKPLPGRTYQYIYSVKDASDLLTLSFYFNWDSNIDIQSYKVSNEFKAGTTDFIEFIKLWNEKREGVVALGRVWYDGGISGNEIEVIRFNVKISENAKSANIDVYDAEVRDPEGKLFALKSNPTQINTLPVNFALNQNYPNPFNPSTKISFELPEAAKVSLTIYNTLGQVITKVISNESLDAGRYEKVFDASEIASGIYLYKLSIDKFTATRKMVFLR